MSGNSKDNSTSSITLENTLKSNDTEEKIDIWFYRPLGFQVAKFCAWVGITPNTVTIVSIFFGVAAGILFYYPELWINVIGMGSLMFANLLDSTDGQLARMTNNKSRLGRILDGAAGNFWFISIYIALILRSINEGWDSTTIWCIGVAAGVSHIIQSCMADYYRNVHLFFIKGKAGSELDNTRDLQAEYNTLSWSKNFGQKLIAKTYLDYTARQEFFSPQLQKLLQVVKSKFPTTLPSNLIEDFRLQNRPLMKYTNILQFNTRVIFLFVCLFIDKAWVYFAFDLLVLTSILVYMVVQQEKISKYFHHQLTMTNEYSTL
jgi:hypothetical protein